MSDLILDGKPFLEAFADKLGIDDPKVIADIRRRTKLSKEYKNIKQFINTARESLDCLEVKLENFYYESVLGEVEVDHGA